MTEVTKATAFEIFDRSHNGETTKTIAVVLGKQSRTVQRVLQVGRLFAAGKSNADAIQKIPKWRNRIPVVRLAWEEWQAMRLAPAPAAAKAHHSALARLAGEFWAALGYPGLMGILDFDGPAWPMRFGGLKLPGQVTWSAESDPGFQDLLDHTPDLPELLGEYRAELHRFGIEALASLREARRLLDDAIVARGLTPAPRMLAVLEVPVAVDAHNRLTGGKGVADRVVAVDPDEDGIGSVHIGAWGVDNMPMGAAAAVITEFDHVVELLMHSPELPRLLRSEGELRRLDQAAKLLIGTEDHVRAALLRRTCSHCPPFTRAARPAQVPARDDARLNRNEPRPVTPLG